MLRFFNKNVGILLVAAWLLPFPSSVYSQLNIEDVSNYSLKDGLSDRAVQDIVQDEDGFIWIATNNGLNRFDGYRFINFDNNENTEFLIALSRVHDLEILANGKLGLKNTNEPSFFEILDRHTLKSQKIKLNEENGISGSPLSLFFEKKKNVHVLTLQDSSFHIYQSDEKLFFHQVAQINLKTTSPFKYLKFHKGPSGNYWIFDENNGLVKLNEQGKELYHWPLDELHQRTKPSNIDYPTGFLHEDKKERLWLALPFRKGVFQIPADQTNLSFLKGLPQAEIYYKIWEQEDGSIGFGTFEAYWKIKQLLCLNNDGTVTHHDQLIDIEATIGTLYKPAHENIIWMGTYVGMFKIDLSDRPIQWLLADRQLADNRWDDGISIRGITGDEQGNVFISRELSAWYQTTEELPPAEEIILKDESGNKINLWCCSNVVCDELGMLWGGSCTDKRDGLLHRYNPKSGETRTLSLNAKTIRHMILTKNGELVLATGASGSESKLLFFNRRTEKFTTYLNDDGTNPLANFEPQYVKETQDGALWVGTVKGLIRIDPVQKTSLLFQQDNSELTNDDITSILEAPDGKLFLGTHGGLNILNPKNGSVKSFNISHGLSNNIVAGILPDGENGYWIPTYYGISHFNPQEELFSTFYKEKGLTFNEFNRMAMHRDSEGKFYFGTINGINIFKNEDIKKSPFDVVHPKWTKITVYSRGTVQEEIQSGLEDIQTIDLDHSDDLIRFEFCLPVFEDIQGNRFAVKLEGRDTSWRYLGNQHFYELNHPSPGRYLLKVKSVPNNGMWGETELSLQLNISKAFHQTLWFYIGLPVIILLTGFLLTKYFISRIRSKEEEQTRINKKFAELELQALQSQMNPHFVFNSLGAIQYFIQNNNQEAADAYLAKFAKLMRLFLESSKNKYISLEEEIKLLALYIELEQMRFEDKFAAEVIVDENIDPHAKEIPSILIQPFVENAINHGLFNKLSKGHLTISFTEKEDGSLVCTIEDNGIGRTKAEELKNGSSRNYKSRGMQIVRERLEVLQEVDDVKIKVDVEDLFPDQQDPGTKVIIEIQDFD